MGGLRPLMFAAALLPAVASAEAESVHGRLQLQDVYAREGSDSVAAALDAQNRNDVLGDARLTWQPRLSGWNADFAYALAFDAGDAPALAADTAALGLLPPAPPLTWWDLTHTIADKRHFTMTQKIDRLSIGYASTHFVIRAGRQALTWGAGLVFHPMDLFDPFAPDATDVEYKPGTDMLYSQYLFNDGSDMQLVIVPRPARRGGGLSTDASSAALHFSTAIGRLRTTWLIARDHGDITAGAGISGPLGGAAWNAEIVPVFVEGDGVYVSALLNISNADKLWGRDITYFAEYYRNGFGLNDGRQTLFDLPPVLIDRLLRGQTFNIRRDYFAAGAQFQWTPLLEISPTLIANLDDGSLYAIAQATYSLSDNLNLIAGAQAPIGPANTEFGGVPITPDVPLYLEQPIRLYVQFRRYF